ncbi:MAG: DUF3276 family protein [Chitinophagales bacterium]|nr:DUF3276 family protein [Chitinophagales bacterium]
MENDSRKTPAVYSKTIRAGRRRTYFFDVRTTRGNDYYVTITESKKRFNEDGYDRHKIFLYKEDFNKFLEAMNEVIGHVKTDLLPEYDFDEFNHAGYEEGGEHHDNHRGEEGSNTAPEPKVEVTEEDRKQMETPPPPIDDDDLKM